MEKKKKKLQQARVYKIIFVVLQLHPHPTNPTKSSNFNNLQDQVYHLKEDRRWSPETNITN